MSRSRRVESWHRGSLVVVRDGEVIFALGAPDEPVFCRSAVKPLQALPLIETCVADRLGVDAEELALTSASHNGTPFHTAIAQRLLDRGDLSEEHLLLGPHAPFDKKASLAIAAAAGKPRRLHNNCSGKHAGFLLLAREMGVDADRYLDPESDSQRLIRRTVAELTELHDGEMTIGLDGCGAPTLALPLTNLARGFANLTNPGRLAPVRRSACARLLAAITEHPVALAGEGRLSTALIRALPGRIYPKNGAEGVFAFGLPGLSVGVAIKVDDGAERGFQPVIVELLLRLGVFSGGEASCVPRGLAVFHHLPVRNTQKIVVGEVRSACDLSPIEAIPQRDQNPS